MQWAAKSPKTIRARHDIGFDEIQKCTEGKVGISYLRRLNVNATAGLGAVANLIPPFRV